MSEYAGKRKVSKDIEKKLKAEKSREKSNKKKRDLQSIYYYAQIINQNKK